MTQTALDSRDVPFDAAEIAARLPEGWKVTGDEDDEGEFVRITHVRGKQVPGAIEGITDALPIFVLSRQGGAVDVTVYGLRGDPAEVHGGEHPSVEAALEGIRPHLRFLHEPTRRH